MDEPPRCAWCERPIEQPDDLRVARAWRITPPASACENTSLPAADLKYRSDDADVTGMAVCAWCGRQIDDGTEVHGVPYHWQCLKRRAVVLRQEPLTTQHNPRTLREKIASMLRRLRQRK